MIKIELESLLHEMINSNRRCHCMRDSVSIPLPRYNDWIAILHALILSFDEDDKASKVIDATSYRVDQSE